jgi:hypothetical protein
MFRNVLEWQATDGDLQSRRQHPRPGQVCRDCGLLGSTGPKSAFQYRLACSNPRYVWRGHSSLGKRTETSQWFGLPESGMICGKIGAPRLSMVLEDLSLFDTSLGTLGENSRSELGFRMPDSEKSNNFRCGEHWPKYTPPFRSPSKSSCGSASASR